MVFDAQDLVYYQKGGDIFSGGYKIDSLLMKKGGAIVTNHDPTQSGGGNLIQISAALKEMAVPAGLLYIQQTIGNKYFTENREAPVSESLYNNLLDLVDINKENNKKYTHKKKSNNNRKTKKIKITK